MAAGSVIKWQVSTAAFVSLLSGFLLCSPAASGEEFVPSIYGKRLFMSPAERRMMESSAEPSVKEPASKDEIPAPVEVEVSAKPVATKPVAAKKLSVSLDGIVVTPNRKPVVWVNGTRLERSSASFSVVSVNPAGVAQLRLHGELKKLRPGKSVSVTRRAVAR